MTGKESITVSLSTREGQKSVTLDRIVKMTKLREREKIYKLHRYRKKKCYSLVCIIFEVKGKNINEKTNKQTIRVTSEKINKN